MSPADGGIVEFKILRRIMSGWGGRLLPDGNIISDCDVVGRAEGNLGTPETYCYTQVKCSVVCCRNKNNYKTQMESLLVSLVLMTSLRSDGK